MRTAAHFTFPLRTLVAAVCLLAAVSPAFAQQNRVKVTAARVGLPPGRAVDRDESGSSLHLCKFGAWAPVYVELQVLEAVNEPVELVIETPDPDEITTTLAVPINLAGVAPNTEVRAWNAGMMPYLRPAAGTGETTVYVRSAKGVALSEPFRLRYLRMRDPLNYIVLSLGNKLPAFDLPKPATGGQEQSITADSYALRNGRVELAAITDIDQLPDQWFGYEVADLVVLTTASADFLDRLFGEKGSATDKLKRAALLEWVRRGGRVVVSIGSNATGAVQMAALQDLLPYAINPTAPTRPVSELVLAWPARESSQTSTQGGTLSVKGGGTLTVANLTPKPGRGRVVIPPPSRQAEQPETVAVQGSYGLGRVTLITFDLDRPPFTEFTERVEFWDWVLREGGAAKASIGQESKVRTSYATFTEEEDEIAAALRTHIDTFDGVPVISFGWVAVFIGLYILLIGPIEYYFLKRVLGRLELTWITFPVIVITVSAAAYFTAYAVKGRDLKTNKVDVVEVVAELDPQTGKPAGGRVYGTTWFTVFSPRIDNYTIGVTPAEKWTANPNTPGAAVVGWVGGPRSGRASLVRRRSSYHVDAQAVADGMENVPVQVWSTKSFTANWAADMDPNAPVVESRLVHPPGAKDLVIGSFVNRMPFPEITDCVAFYGDKAYPIGTIAANTEVRLVLDKGKEVSAVEWLRRESQLSAVLARAPSLSGQTSAGPRTAGSAAQAASGPSGPLPLWGVLFHEASLRNEEGVFPSNASLRRLDQSWRLNPENRNEVILVGRVVPPVGPANELLGGDQSPTRLWLKGLPKPGESAPEVPGTARQETYVRVYLPVRSAGLTR